MSDRVINTFKESTFNFIKDIKDNMAKGRCLSTKRLTWLIWQMYTLNFIFQQNNIITNFI